MWFPEVIKESNDEKHKLLLRKAYELAWNYSDDPSTKTGAVLVDDNLNIIETGSNHFLEGVEKLPQRQQRPLKYSYIEHAERDIVYKCAKKGINTSNLTMYMPWLPCSDCARAIIGSGIKRLVCHKTMIENYNGNIEKWKPSLENAINMLSEAGVEIIAYTGKIGDVKAMFDYKEWDP